MTRRGAVETDPPWAGGLDVRHHVEGDVVSVTMRGELEYTTAARLGEVLAGVEPAVPNLVLDLGGVEFIDSSGLGALVAAYKHCQQLGGMLEITHPTPEVRRLLALTGLDHVLAIR